jgi:hypothetical protein
VETQLRYINVLAVALDGQQEEHGVRVDATHPPVVDDVQPKKEEEIEDVPAAMEDDNAPVDAAHPPIADNVQPKKEEAEVVPAVMEEDNAHVRGAGRDTPRPEHIEGSVVQKVSIMGAGE